MRHVRMGVGLLALAGMLTIGAGAARGETIAEPARATPVDADVGAIVWSAYDASVNAYRLTLRQGRAAPRVLPVTPSPVPFDADLGDDENGRRVVVYSACPSGPQTCDVRLLRLATGADEAVGVAARPGVREHAPTISRGRLAWAVGGGQEERPRVLLHRLGERRAPIALPTVPRRRCGRDLDGKRACTPVFGTVTALELRGRTLIQSLSTTQQLVRDIELRHVDVNRRTSRQILAAGAGESGQAFIGPSIDGGTVYAYKTCFGDPGGCERRAGVLRYRLSSRRLSLAEDPRQLSGFSVDGEQVVASEGSERRYCEIEQGGYPGLPGQQIGPCPIETRSLPRRWAPYA